MNNSPSKKNERKLKEYLANIKPDNKSDNHARNGSQSDSGGRGRNVRRTSSK